MKLKITKTKKTSILMYRRHTGTRTAKVPQESMSALERLRKFVRDAETEILLNGPGNISPGLRHRRRRAGR